MVNRSLLVACVISGLALVVGVFSLHEPRPALEPAASAVHSQAIPAPAVVPPSRASGGTSVPASTKSSEQERLEQRRWHYEMVDSLLIGNEIERARQYLDEGAARYGEDSAAEWRDLDSGYRLIADCLEQPNDAKHRVRARAFVGVTEAPGLVPKIQAACGK